MLPGRCHVKAWLPARRPGKGLHSRARPKSQLFPSQTGRWRPVPPARPEPREGPAARVFRPQARDSALPGGAGGCDLPAPAPTRGPAFPEPRSGAGCAWGSCAQASDRQPRRRHAPRQGARGHADGVWGERVTPRCCLTRCGCHTPAPHTSSCHTPAHTPVSVAGHGRLWRRSSTCPGEGGARVSFCPRVLRPSVWPPERCWPQRVLQTRPWRGPCREGRPHPPAGPTAAAHCAPPGSRLRGGGEGTGGDGTGRGGGAGDNFKTQCEHHCPVLTVTEAVPGKLAEGHTDCAIFAASESSAISK